VRNKELYLVEKNHHEQLEDETAATIPSYGCTWSEVQQIHQVSSRIERMDKR
jgi:hypothetical protein